MERRMKYMTWKDFDKYRKETDTVIIPSGAYEVYGYHMPLGSDTIIAEKVCQMVAERTGAIVGPWLEVGNSKCLYDFPGTVYIRPETLKNVYRDICETFIKWGFKKFFILNAHGANTVPLCDMLEDLMDDYGVKVAHVPWWQYMPFVSDKETGLEDATPSGHSGEICTSCMLYIDPSQVDMSKAANTPSLFNDQFPGINRCTKLKEYTESGTIGNANLGSAEKGKKLVEKAVDNMVRFIQTWDD